jgi:glutamyl-tRNA synthetase
MKTRTRFAPSPTGYIHVGGIRTALFAWLTAKQAGGEFILRIEDTDKVREVEGSEKHIIESLAWLGLSWDEGPDIGGQYQPYRQSERLDVYKKWAEKLIVVGRAYPDPYTKDELDEFRLQAKKEKKAFLFRDHRPKETMDWDGKTPLRFKSDPKSYQWHDLVMGDLSSGPEVIDDFILIKSDGYPTYNFCHIVDDQLMQISHIIRSQEFIASVPKFLNLYEALDIKPPLMATVPAIMGPDGKKKLSKRDGAKDILDYKKEGYLPESLINMMAQLGWNDGTTQEFFSLNELIDKFSLSRVQRSGAHFDENRLTWMNGHYIRNYSDNDLYKMAKPFFPSVSESFDDEYKIKVLSLIKERLKFFSEIPTLTEFFFVDLAVDPSLINNNKFLSKIDKKTLLDLLASSKNSLEKSDFSVKDLNDKLNQLLEDLSSEPKILFSLIRIATTEAPASPPLAETMHVLGKDKSLNRIKSLIDSLSEA